MYMGDYRGTGDPIDGRWVGMVDATLQDHEKSLDVLTGLIGSMSAEMTKIRIALNRVLVLAPVVLILANTLVGLFVYMVTG